MSNTPLLLVVGLLAAASACAVEPAGPPERVRLGEGDLLTGVPGQGPLSLAEVRAWLAEPDNHRVLAPVLPIGLDEGAADLRGLDTEPLTRAKIELGRQLFFDKRLSVDNTVSCASCHAPDQGYALNKRLAPGVRDQLGSRNPPTAANRLFSSAQFRDGRAASLEEQAVGPIAHPKEMDFSHEGVVERLSGIEGYRLQFKGVFEEGVTIDNVGRAIAAFERVLVSGPSPWDLHKRLERVSARIADDEAYGDEPDPADLVLRDELREATAAQPLTESARRGAKLFFSQRVGCAQCHAGANFSDERYHNLGVGLEGVDDPGAKDIDWGRHAVTDDDAARGAFKTPGLRNVAQTAPYMHDGSQASLNEVVAWYARGGGANRWLSPLVERIDLTKEEQDDLVLFLVSLTGRWPQVQEERLPLDPTPPIGFAEKVLETTVEHLRKRGPSYESATFIGQAIEDAWLRRQELFEIMAANLKSAEPENLVGALETLRWLRLHAIDRSEKGDRLGIRFAQRTDSLVQSQLEHLLTIENDSVSKHLAVYLGSSDIPERKRALFRIIGSAYAKNAKVQALIVVAWDRDPSDMEALQPHLLEDSRASRHLPYHYRNSYGEASIPYLKQAVAEAANPATGLESALELILLGDESEFEHLLSVLEEGSSPHGKGNGLGNQIRQFAWDRLQMPHECTTPEQVAEFLRAKQREMATD